MRNRAEAYDSTEIGEAADWSGPGAPGGRNCCVDIVRCVSLSRGAFDFDVEKRGL